MRRPCRQTVRAFTLVELIVVVVLVGVLAAASAPVLASIDAARRTAAVDTIRSDLAFARAHAMSTGRRTWVSFDAKSSSWAITAETDGAVGRASAWSLSSGADGGTEDVALGSGDSAGLALALVDFDAGEVIGFDRIGRPLVEDGVPLAKPGGVRVEGGRLVAVEPVTGYVRVMD